MLMKWWLLGKTVALGKHCNNCEERNPLVSELPSAPVPRITNQVSRGAVCERTATGAILEQR